ncbi:MAG TPA: VOC family protein [Trueperaceae bacterium]|nr:VOC family protein [Trueperaceae bacterium]
MIKGINISNIFVFDQDQALDFYTGKLGLEVSADVEFGNMRWLTVRVPGQPEREIFLEMIGSGPVDPESVKQLRELVSKGATGFTVGFVTNDARKFFEVLKDRGVEVTQEPMEQPYGVDFGIRDPFGNHIRVVEQRPFQPQ